MLHTIQIQVTTSPPANDQVAYRLLINPLPMPSLPVPLLILLHPNLLGLAFTVSPEIALSNGANEEGRR